MGTSQASSATGLATASRRPAASPVDLVGFAAGQVLRGEADADAVPAILGGLADLFGCAAALALQQDAGRELTVLTAHPRHAATDKVLLAGISALSAKYGDLTAEGGYVEASLSSGRRPASVRLAYAAPPAGRRLCAIALIGDPKRFNAECQATMRGIAAIVAAQIRHANDAAELAERQACTTAIAEVIRELERPYGALLESETRFRLLSQLAPVGIVQTDLNGTCTFANVRWCELAGMSMSQALGASWPTGIHPDDVGRLEREYSRAVATYSELCTDCRLRSPDGREVWVHLAVVPIQGAADRPCGFLAAVTDVSDLKRAAAEKERLLNAERDALRGLADQTERVSNLIAAAIHGVLFSDENGQVTQVNRSFCDMFGIEDETDQLIGIPTAQIAARIKDEFADPSEFVRRVGLAFTAHRQVNGERIACADGRTFQCDYWPVFVDGTYRGDLWLVLDMSERKALEEHRERLLAAELSAREAAESAQLRLAEQNARLRELDEAKTQFLAAMSHELRTPLTSIVSFTELIMDDEHELSPKTVSSLAVIQRNAERLLRLVGDLLLLNRLEGGAIPLELAAVSVPDLIAEAVSSVSATAAERGVTVRVSAAAGPQLLADDLRLQQVFDNLLSNAIKFSREDGRVEIEATCDGQLWRIDVADDGIGIPADELGQLFGRFARASNARTAGLPGTGLGLSVVKAITELHGGSVEIRSTIGHGTTVSVYLPVRP